VSGFLLDTNVALLALVDPARLAPAVRKAVVKGPNFMSVASYWEVVLKSMKGNLDVGDPRAWWPEALDQLGATPLALRTEHVGEVSLLPSIHRDPFDRILIAQATVERLDLVAIDGEMARYASARLRVVS
jgi:PIN domain nuclease of toxin-antitoxin system